jgi:hypothetical protein
MSDGYYQKLTRHLALVRSKYPYSVYIDKTSLELMAEINEWETSHSIVAIRDYVDYHIAENYSIGEVVVDGCSFRFESQEAATMFRLQFAGALAE